ncbi:MAG TPA: hypothetical protein DEA96_13360 [Leptospiraceae bacterium]|nr:hypothetical protein [Spirochaetaceae bacterium]HBS05950.1 hypothetical protein [Leptospiraceae bacterium]|tara:strand:+ start:27044 stop:29284 length:2241 start_codon:yes stop_codon:yes gene_type:complete
MAELYTGAPLPVDEEDRLKDLYSYEILDTEFEEAFDRITELASRITGAPIALVSLLDEKRQWFKSNRGLRSNETPREQAFCGHAILQDEIFVVEDATADHRFSSNPLVTGDPGLRFYGGYPLKSPSGHKLGTLCVLDLQPRELPPAQAEALKLLADQVVSLLELRKRSLELDRANQERLREQRIRHRFFEASSDLFGIMDSQGMLLDSNEQWIKRNVVPDNINNLGELLYLQLSHGAQFINGNYSANFHSSSDESVITEFATTRENQGASVIIHWKAMLDLKDSLLYLYGRESTREHVLFQELERASQEAMAQARSRSMLMYTLSHEIRNPLHSLLGTIEIMSIEAGPEDVESGDLKEEDSIDTMHSGQEREDQNRYQNLNILEESARGLMSLLDSVLDMGRMEHRGVELRASPFKLSEALSYVKTLVMPSAISRRLLLAMDREAELPDNLLGDRAALQQVLLNLAGNAVKFTEKGHVEIKVRSIPGSKVQQMRAEARCIGNSGEQENLSPESTSVSDRTWILFTVADTGPGINPNKIPDLFEPFEQLDPGLRHTYGGSGLGLAISCNLVQAMNGFIAVEENSGPGATFHVCIPFRIQSAREDPLTEESIPETPDFSGRSILIAEDEPISQILIRRYLEDTGMEIHIHPNGEETVAMATSRPFDIVFLDIHLPDIDGFTICKQIRAFEEGSGQKRVPIIAYTGNSSAEELEASRLAGFDGWLLKPASRKTVIEEIFKWMEAAKTCD